MELAAQAAGAVPLGHLRRQPARASARILDHSEARFVLVEDQEQADKVLGVRGALPRLERIIVDDMRGLEANDDPLLVSLEAVARGGRASSTRASPAATTALLARAAPTDVALLAYTSGTTGQPRPR